MPGHFLFLSPAVLGFFVALPVLWWLLRVLPPSPRKVSFPALMFLRDLATSEKTPARMPWWYLLLRLILASLIILAFARPVIDPQPILKGDGAVLIAIDNDWASARAWDVRQKALRDLIDAAEREARPVLLLPTAPPANGASLEIMGPMAAKSAYAAMARIVPEPWPSDWHQATDLLTKNRENNIAYAVWLNSGLGGNAAVDFYNALKVESTLKNVRVLNDAAETPLYLLTPPTSGTDSFIVLRAATDQEGTATIVGRSADGRELARRVLSFAAGAPRAEGKLDLPSEARNRITRLEIEGEHSAGGVALSDADWQHRPVGIVGDKTQTQELSLLSGAFYIERALKPFADIHIAPLDQLLAQNMAVIIVTDAAPLSEHDRPALMEWVKKGGVFLRFAGPNIAATTNATDADLMPVPLRVGDRAMGGSMSWDTPQKLGPFPETSPFRGLAVPSDVAISRQILAEPSADVASHSWAVLQDGTPLVTAKNIDHGLSVFFHVPARSEWSNLPLSGLFVDMLRRLVALSSGMPSQANFTSLAPASVLDAFGDEEAPGSAVEPLSGDDFSTLKPGPTHPPGMYGEAGLKRAFNLGAALEVPDALSGITSEKYQLQENGQELQPILLTAAFILLLIDFLISLYLRGLIRPLHAGAAFLLITLAWPGPAHADNKEAIEFTSKTYLAYMETGDQATDQLSEAGLVGLARILDRRTSLNDVGVAGVNPESDDLAFFPLIYWPLTNSERPLSLQAARRVNDYLQHGGMLLLDSGGENMPAPMIQGLLVGISIPPLVHIPENHVLRRTFYLLDDFPGRFAGGELWLEPEESSSYDDVASVIAGSGGWAGAWATDENGRPLYPCMPGGEVQREQAYRFGVNVVMYALTGNYKSDQMHIEALFERQHQ